jgi:RNA polymerase sigma-70 factor (ECF subfamily)
MIRRAPATGPPVEVVAVGRSSLQPCCRPGRVVAVTTEPPVSFDDVYAAHFVALTVPLFAYLGDRQRAQDVVQEAFCRALIRWRTVSRSEDPVGWIRGTAWRLAARRPGFFHRPAFFHRRRANSPPALVTALGTLPPAHRRAMVLRYLGELTPAEIADQEGVAEATVESWLRHARTALDAYPAETTAQEVRRA